MTRRIGTEDCCDMVDIGLIIDAILSQFAQQMELAQDQANIGLQTMLDLGGKYKEWLDKNPQS